MSGVSVIALAGGVAILAGIFELLRRGRIREKYAVLWSVVGAVVAIFALMPHLIDVIAKPLHIADPPNLLLFSACAVLLLVVVQLSCELSRLEDKTRVLAEEVALLRHSAENQSVEG